MHTASDLGLSEAQFTSMQTLVNGLGDQTAEQAHTRFLEIAREIQKGHETPRQAIVRAANCLSHIALGNETAKQQLAEKLLISNERRDRYPAGYGHLLQTPPADRTQFVKNVTARQSAGPTELG